MYKRYFGKKKQMTFNSREAYYQFLGFLANNSGTTSIVWEENEEQGAWGSEGRIQFYIDQPASLNAKLIHTAGTSSIVSRVNCNEYISHIVKWHRFTTGNDQDFKAIRGTISENDLEAFDKGLAIN